ncbi:MAG: hypothetical protein QMD86_02630 [Patescibacteria group bacterium]|nr:hypothetical protein [Patescibacteria group bacterium]
MRVIMSAVLIFFVLAIPTKPILVFAANFPQIENFLIQDSGNALKISFDFKGVIGGLEKAEFTVGYVVAHKEGVITRYDIAENLILAPKSTTTIIKGKFQNTDGRFEISIPVSLAKNGLKPGDKIKYFIFLIDELGRKSNIIFCEFELAERWEI